MNIKKEKVYTLRKTLKDSNPQRLEAGGAKQEPRLQDPTVDWGTSSESWLGNGNVLTYL